MYEIKKIDILSVAKLSAFVITAVYLVAGICFTIFLFIVSSYSVRHFFDADFDDFTFLSLLGIAVIVGIVGFGAGAAGAAVYNLIARSMGGIKMDIILRDDEDKN